MDDDSELQTDSEEGLQEGDIYTDDTRVSTTLKEKSGYIFDLSADQIVRIFYFFGARRLRVKALRSATGSPELSPQEKQIVNLFFEWFHITPMDKTEYKKSYRSLVVKFKQLCDFLRIRPAYITPEIHKACKEAGYDNIIKSVILVVNDKQQVVPRVLGAKTSDRKIAPIGKMETLLWRIQELSVDKMMMILENITPSDVKKANLGMKSKAFRDIFAALHMARLQNKTPNQALVNLQINTAEPVERLRVYSSYINANREKNS